MLNTFPELLSYAFIAPLVLRVTVGLIAINLGILKLGKERMQWEQLIGLTYFRPAGLFVRLIAYTEIVGGILLFLGSRVQLVALVFAILFFCEMVLEYREESLQKRNLPFYILMFAISLSLLALGAGAFAFDIAL